MTYLDELRHQLAIITQLIDLTPCADRNMRQWTRGGLPTQSFGEHTSSREPALPLPDRTDRSITNDRTLRNTSARRTTLELAAQLRIATRWTQTAPPVPEPEREPCQRLTCNNEVTNIAHDRLHTSRLDGLKVCGRCAQHERRHAQPYPARSGVDTLDTI
jgi:hypothetical protein